ncbi:MAG TPA: enoyl-CoA hydratase-related protein [Spongiibacteraceae bacterium]|jgi:2-(1,2-epoxy-1,2-dihydrophenyl)acetyl-CoA isomerase
MSDKPTVLEQYDRALIVTMNQLSNRNALDGAMKDALFEAAQLFCSDAALHCLVITGTDNIFCAGGDLRNMSGDRRTVAVRERMARTHRITKLLSSCEKPVITAVNGAAVGAGLSLALLGDIIVAADDAFFVSGFSKVGVFPDGGIVYNLPRAVGLVRAKDILLTNRRIDAHEALAIGLVSRVLPKMQFNASVRELATQIANGPAISLGLTKNLLNASHRDNLDDFLTKESLAQAVVFGTDDFAEGNLAFAEKREPKFSGK